VSNFLKNLARRSAGLPLAAECRPSRAPEFEGSFEGGAGLNEVTSEQTAASHIEAPAAPALQTLNAAAPRQVQRSVAEQTGLSAAATTAFTAKPPSAHDATTVLQPSSSLEQVSFREQAIPLSPAASNIHEPAVSNEAELTARVKSTRVQTIMSPRRDLSPAINPPAITSAHRERQEPLSPEMSVEEQRESTPEVKLAGADHLIRPAPTDPTLPFQFPRIATASPQPISSTPIEVRIGRVEVRGVPPLQQPVPATPPPSPPLGFASYHRVRRYRN